MPFNGSGIYNRIYNFVTDRNNGVKIQSARMDAEMDGIATALSNCITKDGQTTITADIPFNNQKITGLGEASAGSHALNRDTADARYGMVVSSQTVTFASGATSALALGTAFRTFRVIFTGVRPVTNNASLTFQVSLDNGSSWRSTSGDYFRVFHYNDTTTTMASLVESTANAFAVTGGIRNVQSSDNASGEFLLSNVSGLTSQVIGQAHAVSGADLLTLVTIGGWVTHSGITHIRFLMSAGNISTGKFEVIGIP